MKGQFPRKRGYQPHPKNRRLLIEVVNTSFNHIDLSNVASDNVSIIKNYVRGIASKQLSIRARAKYPINTGAIINRTIQRVTPIATQYGAIVNSYIPKPPIKTRPKPIPTIPDTPTIPETPTTPVTPKAITSWKGISKK